MEPTSSADLLNSSPNTAQLVFEPSFYGATTIPSAFIWPEAQSEQMSVKQAAIDVPVVDLACFRSRDPNVVQAVARVIASASETIGFLHVVNHGVPESLIEAAHEVSQSFFDLPFATKQRVNRSVGESFGYASSFTGRFTTRLPWKETFSLQTTPVSNIKDYFERVLGEQHEESSSVFQRYCQAMIKLGLEIIELLGLALGLKRTELREFFEDNSSILRLNYYPPCQQPSLTYGTGPHTDPTGLTILHQDEVPGLQVFQNGTWFTILPRKDAFVVNIGDTLMALTNKRFKSCVHRAVVNKMIPRRSLTFFLNPGFQTLLSPPKLLVDADHPRAYLDFTWGKFLYFTQCVHRSGVLSLDAFNDWLAVTTGEGKWTKEDGAGIA